MAPTNVRVVIVDDEPLARERLRQLLSRIPAVLIAGECNGASDARSVLPAADPDVVLLDVEMPDGSGFEVLDNLDAERIPLVIFVTAHESYAVKAFDAAAVDYVLKPVDPERLEEAIERARDRLSHSVAGIERTRLRALVDVLRDARQAERVRVRDGTRTYFVDAADIVWVEAKRNHCLVHLRERSAAVRETLSSMEARLPSHMFLRVHRSAIVNVDRITYVEPWFRGEHVLVLDDGTRLTTSRTHGRALHTYLAAR